MKGMDPSATLQSCKLPAERADVRHRHLRHRE